MVTDWYRKYVGTPYEGGRMPWLYHHYAGHDNNRDWFMFNLSETKAVTKVLYHDWIPQVHIDEHQMGSTGAHLFLPPFMDPPVPTIHPLVWQGIALCVTNMAYDLQTQGGQPFAFIIPKDQRDYPTTLRMLDILMFGGIEIYQAKEDFTADGKLYYLYFRIFH